MWDFVRDKMGRFGALRLLRAVAEAVGRLRGGHGGDVLQRVDRRLAQPLRPSRASAPSADRGRVADCVLDGVGTPNPDPDPDPEPDPDPDPN